ncbi:MAG: hypothetical protein COA96_08945 [SAR86 cluster bacterium]|uniref:Uncharacterized protein n=1 Tax=SAR86 cluster bacterium TaxID=2030880 RepID=A0A2A5AZW0_9GAMM|nr:MAG: hypothetical protein COA96_08945 [SAR86 cluster bacterium]
MRNSIFILLLSSLILCPAAFAVDSNCSSFADNESSGDFLIALVSSASNDSLLQVDFDNEEICTLDRDRAASDISDQAVAEFHINASQDEFAVKATVEDFSTWLRIDTEYSEELLLDRKTGEGLGLTEAEFQGDNSQLEGQDFFTEFVDTFLIGSFEPRSVEASIPHFGVSYEHYQGRGELPVMPDAAAEFLTVGTIGQKVLERLIITLDVAESKMYLE